MFFRCLLITLIASAATQATASCLPDSHGLLEKLYLKAGLLLKDEELKEVNLYKLELGAKHSAWCLGEHWEASAIGTVYYSQREVRLESAEAKSQTMGLGLARISYDNWSHNKGFTPYAILNLEKTNSRSKDDDGITERDHSSVFVWGFGVEQTFGPYDGITLDLSRRFKFDKIASDRLSDDLSLSLKFNFLKLFKDAD